MSDLTALERIAAALEGQANIMGANAERVGKLFDALEGKLSAAFPTITPAPALWMIWCNERAQWWKPGRLGYTSERDEAGQYTLEEALEICAAANIHCKAGYPPSETMVPA